MKKLLYIIVNWFKSLFSVKAKNIATPEIITREFEPYRPPIIPKRKVYNNRKRTRGRNFQVISYRINSHFRTINPGILEKLKPR